MNIFIILSSAFALIGPILYIVSIVKGRSKPQRMTRFVLMVVVFVAVLSFHAAVDFPTFILAIALLIGNIAMFILSIKYGMGGWHGAILLV